MFRRLRWWIEDVLSRRRTRKLMDAWLAHTDECEGCSLCECGHERHGHGPALPVLNQPSPCMKCNCTGFLAQVPRDSGGG